MNRELSPLEVSNQLKEFVLEFVKNGLDRRFIHGSFDIIETALKALDIIKNKRVNIEYIKCCETYEQYQTICSYWNEITQVEFNLLKESL